MRSSMEGDDDIPEPINESVTIGELQDEFNRAVESGRPSDPEKRRAVLNTIRELRENARGVAQGDPDHFPAGTDGASVIRHMINEMLGREEAE